VGNPGRHGPRRTWPRKKGKGGEISTLEQEKEKPQRRRGVVCCRIQISEALPKRGNKRNPFRGGLNGVRCIKSTIGLLLTERRGKEGDPVLPRAKKKKEIIVARPRGNRVSRGGGAGKGGALLSHQHTKKRRRARISPQTTLTRFPSKAGKVRKGRGEG